MLFGRWRCGCVSEVAVCSSGGFEAGANAVAAWFGMVLGFVDDLLGVVAL